MRRLVFVCLLIASSVFAGPIVLRHTFMTDGGVILNGPSAPLNVGEAGISTDGGIAIVAQTLPTCSVAIEFKMASDILSGINTGKRSKLCMCTSNGSAVYAWQNMATGTIGTSTTCGTE